jgi:hypothetical protein
MATATTYPHIQKIDGEPARLERIPRVRVAQIAMDYLFHGWSVDEMCRHHPYLQPVEAHAAMTYYFDHAAQIDAEIKAEIQQADEDQQRAFPSPIYLKLKSKGLI